MDGMKISELDFIRLLPAFMRDDEAAIALSIAMNHLIAPPSRRIKTIRVWDRIDDMTEAECDEMAWELAVDWYDHSYNLDIKREIIKNSLNIRRKAGTKAAVEKALSNIFKDVRLEEWFEYGGMPYFFRLEIKIPEEGITAKRQSIALGGIDYYKNVRSRLEAINYITSVEGCVRVGVYTSMSACVEIWPELTEKIEVEASSSIGGMIVTDQQIEVLPELAKRIEMESIIKAGDPVVENRCIEIFPQ